MADGYTRTFTLEIDGRPTLAFAAGSAAEARSLGRENWLQDDLMAMTSGGTPLWKSNSKLLVRASTPDERAAFLAAAEKSKPSEDMFLAYLVDLDAPEHAKP
jgi:hypothetical protein